MFGYNLVVSKYSLYLIITGTPLFIASFCYLYLVFIDFLLSLESVSSYFAGYPDTNTSKGTRASHQNAKDAAYIPPTQPNVGNIPKPVTKQNNEMLLPVHNPEITTSIFKRAMDLPLTITQQELLSLSPEIHSQVRDITTSC